MGSCISKCRPKKEPQEEEYFNNVQDKLVISQDPIIPSIPLPTKKFLPTPSNSSFSTFSCSLASSTSSLSSCSSSIQSSKDRSFSNEFLWSCAKENPHITRVNSVKSSPLKQVVQNKVHPRKLDSPAKPVVPPVKHAVPQKRARTSSPALTRQKSFRKESEKSFRKDSEKVNSTNSFLPSRTLRSPSPSRRFGGNDNYKGNLPNTPYKTNAVNYESFCGRKENLRPASPNNNLRGNSPNTAQESCRKNLVSNKVNGVNSESFCRREENLRPASPNNFGGNFPNKSKESCSGYKEIEMNCESLCVRKENLRPPSPNDFGGNLQNTPQESSKNLVDYKGNEVKSELFCVRKENIRPPSPNNNSNGNRGFLRNRDTCSYQIGSKVDEIAVGEVTSNRDVDIDPMEDIDNPLISLDCFIFL